MVSGATLTDNVSGGDFSLAWGEIDTSNLRGRLREHWLRLRDGMADVTAMAKGMRTVPLDARTVRAHTGLATVDLSFLRREQGPPDLARSDFALRSTLHALSGVAPADGGRVVLVTSIDRKPVARFSLKLGRVAHSASAPAIVVDARLRKERRPKSCAGLAEHLSTATPLTSLVRSADGNGLAFLTAGDAGLPASSLLSSPAWRGAIDVFRRRYATSIVAAPSVGADGFADAARISDAVVLLVDRNVDPAYLADRTEFVARSAPRASVLVGLV